MATHEQHQTPTREREVIVTNGDGHRSGGPSVASVVMAIVGIIVVLLVGWFAIQAISGTDGGDAELDVPQEMDVNIGDGEGGGQG